MLPILMKTLMEELVQAVQKTQHFLEDSGQDMHQDLEKNEEEDARIHV